MKNLFKGVKKFRETEYRRNKKVFENLTQSQHPHTLFIGCSDSRVIPDLITRSLPGELFVVRNIANIVPYWRQSDEYLATTSAVEYAVLVLEVENIVICGHSNCGGCRALMDKEKSSPLPHVSKWMELAAEVKEKFKNKKGPAPRPGDVEKENVLRQIEHLMTYPFIKSRYEEGKIKVYGWYYDIGSGSVYNYDRKKKRFINIK